MWWNCFAWWPEDRGGCLLGQGGRHGQGVIEGHLCREREARDEGVGAVREGVRGDSSKAVGRARTRDEAKAAIPQRCWTLSK